MKKLNSPDLRQDSSADSNSTVSTIASGFRNENDSAEGFIIGALLFSLLSSTRSEAVSGLLPNEE